MTEKKYWPKLSALALAVSAATLAMPLAAQQAEDEEQEGPAAELGDVAVTGSRIKRPEFTTPAPVTTITAEQISQTSFLTLGDLLSELPQLSNTFTLQNSARFIGTAGGGFLNLRGLGTDRTLVLINGKRHVAGSVGDSSVDVNSIPTDLIERIEISTGAQSAVYGSDAVGGTVNIILRDDFNGVRARASTGFADNASDDFHRYSAGITAGRDFVGGRGNAVVSLGWDRQNLLTAGEFGGRALGAGGLVPNPEDGDFIDDNGFEVDDGIPDDIFVPNNRFFILSNGGTLFQDRGAGGVLPLFVDNPASPLGRLLPDGSLAGIDPSTFEFLDGPQNCAGAGCEDFLDLESFQVMQVGFERFTFDTLMTFDFNENVEGYAEVRYANVDSRQQGQPSFDFFPLIPVTADNPFMSEEVRDAILSNGTETAAMTRFNTDLGLRREFDNRQTARGVVGLRGNFNLFGRTFDFDAFGNFGRSTLERVNENNRIDEAWFAAVDAVQITEDDLADIQDPSFFGGGGVAAGDIVCRSQLQAARGDTPRLANGDLAPAFAVEGCVPADIFGNGNISDEAKAFINSTAVATGEIEQFQTGFNVGSSNLFDPWGAGGIGALAGFEFRSEDASAREDSLSGLGNTFFNALGATDGSFDVTEVYGEVVIPLLKDLPLVKSLQIEGAGRISDFSTIGTVETWEGRASWQPVEQLTIRGSIGESVRAPTIDDLFAPGGENFSNINDPCDQENLSDGRNGREIRIANCIATGVEDPENFNAADAQSVPLVSGGNPDLGEEESDVFTIGFVWSPSFVRNLDLSADLWDIEVTDSIASLGAANITARCVDDPNGIDNQFCPLIDRGSDDNITEIRQFPLNLNEFKTRGVDLGLNYVYNAGDFGTFNLRSTVQYLDQRVFVLNTADNVDIDEGELGDPDWQGNFNLNWTRGNLGGFAQLRFIDEQLIFDQTTLGGGPNNPDPNPDRAEQLSVDLELYLDLGVNYSFPMGFTAQVSVDNVFDNLCPTRFNGRCNGGGSAIFDNVGRFYNFQAGWNF